MRQNKKNKKNLIMCCKTKISSANPSSAKLNVTCVCFTDQSCSKTCFHWSSAGHMTVSVPLIGQYFTHNNHAVKPVLTG